MKTIILAFIIIGAAALLGFRSRWQKPQQLISDNVMSFYELKINSLDGQPMDLEQYKGKYILCVNVASKCGYTPQYADLQKLQDQFKEKLVIIGFPCNQFMGQEPGSATEIASFCSKNYGVTFPISEKIEVKGKNQHPVYQWLTNKQINGVSDADISWNFNKILISPKGQWLQHFGSSVKPLDEAIISKIK
jgi:glutathione peroxidase